MADNSLVDDLDYLRTLAESGEQAPLLGGRFLAWWGAILSIAYIGHYLISTGAIGLDHRALGFWWGGIMAVALIGYFTLMALMPKAKPGKSSAGNRVERMVWAVSGSTIGVYYVTLVVRTAVTNEIDPTLFDAGVILAFALYGVALVTSGKIAGNKVMQFAGFGALTTVSALTFTIGSPSVYLIAGICVALTVFVPGLLMMRAEPTQII